MCPPPVVPHLSPGFGNYFYSDSANVIGAHYVLSKQMPKGEKYLRRATELDPQDGEIRYNLGATLAAMGKIEDAIVEFERAQERGIEVAGEVVGKLREGLKGNKGGGE